jgi:cytochrome c553
MRSTIYVTGCALGLVLVLGGCGSDSDGEPSPGGDMPMVAEPSATTLEIWGDLQGYAAWAQFEETASRPQSATHDNMFVVTYYNEIADQAMQNGTLPLPPGSIFVKENYPSADAATPMALTVMSKGAGEWYWLQATPEGRVFLDAAGGAMEGKNVAMCVGCHTSARDNDFVMTRTLGSPPMPMLAEPSAATEQLWSELEGYTGWSQFEETASRPQSTAHGNMFVVSYFNDVAGGAIQEGTLPLPDGSILIKENYPAADAPTPMALTVMSKRAGEWYWVQGTPDGQVFVDDMGTAMEGTSVAMCVGCHQQAQDNDFIMTRMLQ